MERFLGKELLAGAWESGHSSPLETAISFLVKQN